MAGRVEAEASIRRIAVLLSKVDIILVMLEVYSCYLVGSYSSALLVCVIPSSMLRWQPLAHSLCWGVGSELDTDALWILDANG